MTSEPEERPLHGLPVTDAVLIVDFGGQFTQLIARRVREANVYSEIVPFHAAEKAIAELKPKAIILSGGPASVLDEGSPQVPDAIFAAGVPVLGICYGQQGMVARLGGVVEPSSEREYGSALIDMKAASPLFEGVAAAGETAPVWMSHGDRVASLPEGFVSIATSRNAPYAAIADETAAALRGSVPSRSRPHAQRRCHAAKLRAPDRGLRPLMDDGGFPRC